ncbi:MAG TPA: Sua5 family C-terminal domain-containing protein [Flavilitoribacter sp.]|nr:Sua5 family C-terminal domain-containing protein [Flavilitoribacter sp.]
MPHSTSNPSAPGMLKSHYAPGVPLILGSIRELLDQHPGKRIGVLSFQSHFPQIPDEHQIALSPAGDLKEAARRLFSALRHLDALGIELIIAESLPETSLGTAINDRLRRAASKN